MWISLDGDELVSGHLRRNVQDRNIERDPRVVVSFIGSAEPSVFLHPYAVLTTRAAVEASDGTWDLLNRAKVYIAPNAEFPAPKSPGYIVRYRIERIGGVGPWAQG